MASHPEYNEKTTATEVAEDFADEIRGKSVVITGVSPDSLGEALAIAIASQHPATLILATRTQAKVDQVAQKAKAVCAGTTSIEAVPLDLSSQRSVRQAVSTIQGLVDRIDVLINNAGLMVLNHQFTEEGIELQFGTNHVGHFLLTNLLMEQLKNAAAAPGSVPGATRVVNVTSAGHSLSPIRFHDYNFEGKVPLPDEERPPADLPAMFTAVPPGYNGWLAYGQSKTANILFSRYLTQRLLRPSGIVSYAVHPGSIWTNMSRNLDEEAKAVVLKTSSFWKSTDQGAATTLVAAFDPSLKEPPSPSRVYLRDCQFADTAPHAADPVAAEKLFELSEKLVGTNFRL